jgi:hypothetical protein
MVAGMLTDFGWDYFLFVFAASLGVLQLTAAYSRLYGLLLFNRALSSLLGLVAVVLAFTWFFASEPRNIPDTSSGLDGNQQAILFFAGALAALVTTLVASSLRHWSMAGGGEHDRGLEALRRASYLRVLLKGLDGHWKRSTRSTRRSSSG